MGINTKIEWCHHTFNPWRGCTKVSPGCANCYADTLSKRNPSTLGVWGQHGKRVVAAEVAWREPLKWDRLAKEAGERHRVFCASLADVFEDWQGPMMASGDVILGKDFRASSGSNRLTMGDVRSRLFWLIHETPNLDWLLLTKRPENIGKMFNTENGPPTNVWLGVSVEDQARADERIPLLLQTPAAVRFLSCEPLLGPLEFSNVTRRADAVQQLGKPALDGIHWVIVGGESGHQSRPVHPNWVRSIRDQCNAVGVAFFFKQWGEYAPDEVLPPLKVGESRKFMVVRPDGGNRINQADGRFSGDSPQQGDAWMMRVGKQAAGRILDGREWSEFPEVAR